MERAERRVSLKKAKIKYEYTVVVHAYIPAHNMRLGGLSALCCAVLSL